MPKKKSPLKNKRRGYARIEFLAVEPEVIELINAGHSFKSAYEELKEQNKITMSYATFARHARFGVTPVTDRPLRNQDLKKDKPTPPKQTDTNGTSSFSHAKTLTDEQKNNLC